MGYTVNVDTGGTFTDGIFSSEKEIVKVKVDTTPHDLTLCFMDCLKKGSEKLGFPDLNSFLENVDIIRWSTTVASNVIAERKGPKLGSIISDDLEKEILESPIMSLIPKETVFPTKKPVKEDEILSGLKTLLENGVRRICIALNNSFYDNSDEIKIKKIIEEQYPDHYLGYVPTLLGSEICRHPDSITRVHYSILNAYVHGPMAVSLFKAEDELRSLGYEKPLLVGHINGGVARVAKTKPVDTIESGPIFGIYASSYISKLYNLLNVITLDIGGTTTKIGYITNGKPGINRNPQIFEIPLKIPLIDLKSLAIGGGSVAKVKNGKIELGPESQGAYPGPACYGLGGDVATLTDSFLLCGYINPDYFAGGTRKLDVEEAKSVIREVADQLGGEVEEAAYKIVQRAYDIVTNEIRQLTTEKRFLFTFGGNGGLFGCPIAELTGISMVYFFSLGSVFSAFGSAVADVMHTYEYAPLDYLDAIDPQILTEMQKEAIRDMEGEGLDPSKVNLVLEFEFEDGETIEMPYQSIEEIRKDVSKKERVEIIKLKAFYPSPKPLLIKHNKEGENPSHALKGDREVILNGEWVQAKVYNWDLLKCGNVVDGPAILEGVDTTYLIPEKWRMTVDEYLNGILEVVE